MTQHRVPKYLQLKHDIKDQVMSGALRPGDQIPTENELAETYAMSRHTVRQAIAELVHERLLTREQGRGTFVALNSPNFGVEPNQSGETHIIGVVTTYLSDYIFPSIIRGIESELSKNGYWILLFSTNNSFSLEARALDAVMNKQVDGLIVEPTKSTLPNPNIHRYFQLLERDLPLVTLHTNYQELAAPCVRIDDIEGAHLVTHHLIELGHQRIGGIFKSDDLQGKYRLNGFIRAMQVNGIPLRSQSLSFYTTEERHEAAVKYASLMASSPPETRPTAVVCYNDEIALQLIKQLKIQGLRVPEDLSVTGFDDSQLADTAELGLTTVKHPKFDMGVSAAQLVLESIRNKHKGKPRLVNDFVFPVALVVRSSTSRPND